MRARLEGSGRVIEATALFGAARPFEVSPPMTRLVRQIIETRRGLEHACDGIRESFHLLTADPDFSPAGAWLLLDTTVRWVDTVEHLFETWWRLGQTSERIVRHARAAAAAYVAPAKRAPIRRPTVVLIRRRSVLIAFCVELARKISRGRAPPVD